MRPAVQKLDSDRDMWTVTCGDHPDMDHAFPEWRMAYAYATGHFIAEHPMLGRTIHLRLFDGWHEYILDGFSEPKA